MPAAVRMSGRGRLALWEGAPRVGACFCGGAETFFLNYFAHGGSRWVVVLSLALIMFFVHFWLCGLRTGQVAHADAR